MKKYLVVSCVLFVATLAIGGLMLSGMSGPHMGAAMLAGYLAIVLALLGVNCAIALLFVLPKRARLILVGAAVLAGAIWLVQRGWHAAQVQEKDARRVAAAMEEEAWAKKILNLPRAQLLEWLRDGTYDARLPKNLSPSNGLYDRVEAMATSCQLDGELYHAINGREPFPRNQMINLLEDLRECPKGVRLEWFAHLRPQLFAVSDATRRWELAQNLLDLDGDYLRQFVAAGYALDAAAPGHPPLLFAVLEGDEVMLAQTRILLDLGAHRDVKNDEGLTPAAFLERRTKQMFSDGEVPEEWRQTLALLR